MHLPPIPRLSYTGPYIDTYRPIGLENRRVIHSPALTDSLYSNVFSLSFSLTLDVAARTLSIVVSSFQKSLQHSSLLLATRSQFLSQLVFRSK